MSDPVDHPPHYRASSGFEAIDVIESWKLNFNLGNVVKYTCRAGLKGSELLPTTESKEKTLEDLKKALWYLQREVHRVERETEDWMKTVQTLASNIGPTELGELLIGGAEDPEPTRTPLITPPPQSRETVPSSPPETGGEVVELPRDRREIGERLGDGWIGSPCRLS